MVKPSSSNVGFFPCINAVSLRVSMKKVRFVVKKKKSLILVSTFRGTVWICTEQDAEWSRGLCAGSALPWVGAVHLLQEPKRLEKKMLVAKVHGP
jgi:hypothetical protein